MIKKLPKKVTAFVCSFLLTFSIFIPASALAETTTLSNGFDSLLKSTESPEIKLNSLICNRVGTVSTSSILSWTLDASGNNLTYKYNLYKDSKVVYTTENIKNTLTRLVMDPGVYYLDVTVTDSNNNSINVVSENITVKKLSIPLKISAVSSNVSSVNTGGTVKWTSYASGEALTYKWEVFKDGKSVFKSSESKVDYLDYKITEAGKYKALSTVKDSVGNTATMYSTEVTGVKPAPPTPKPDPKPTPKPPSVDSLVKSSAVYATLNKSGKLTSSATSSSTVVSLSKGSKVEILSDKGGKSYNVRDTKSGKTGWIASSYLSIPSDPATNKNKMTTAQMEQYVNSKGFSSGTQYFIWVDIDRQVTNIFSGKKGSFKLVRSVSCATGKNKTPTTRGTFTISNRGTWFNSPTNPSVGAKYFVRFNGSYLFHSTLYSSSNKNKAVDSRVGVRLSNGCIRLPVDTAKWIYDNVKPGTKVFVN